MAVYATGHFRGSSSMYTYWYMWAAVVTRQRLRWEHICRNSVGTWVFPEKFPWWTRVGICSRAWQSELFHPPCRQWCHHCCTSLIHFSPTSNTGPILLWSFNFMVSLSATNAWLKCSGCRPAHEVRKHALGGTFMDIDIIKHYLKCVQKCSCRAGFGGLSSCLFIWTWKIDNHLAAWFASG